MKTLTTSYRNSLIKLASSLPQGDENRKAILAGLKTSSMTDAQLRVLDTMQKELSVLLKQSLTLCKKIESFGENGLFPYKTKIQESIEEAINHLPPKFQ